MKPMAIALLMHAFFHLPVGAGSARPKTSTYVLKCGHPFRVLNERTVRPASLFPSSASAFGGKWLSLPRTILKQDVMPKFINPFTDVGFKRIFGQEINKDLLIDFLNSLLDGERRVNDIRFLDKELLPAYSTSVSVRFTTCLRPSPVRVRRVLTGVST